MPEDEEEQDTGGVLCYRIQDTGANLHRSVTAKHLYTCLLFFDTMTSVAPKEQVRHAAAGGQRGKRERMIYGKMKMMVSIGPWGSLYKQNWLAACGPIDFFLIILLPTNILFGPNRGDWEAVGF